MKKAITVFIFILFVTALLFVPEVYAQNLSRYRTFSLGTSLNQISKQIDQGPPDAEMIQASPATIQELIWRPATESDSVQEIALSFYNGALYKITASYDSSSTEGLTSDDMVRAISATYGVPTRPATDASSQVDPSDPELATVARWENDRYCLVLSRASFLNTFQVALYSKQMNDQAQASIAEAAREETADAPQKELARVQKAASDLEIARQNNIKAFRP